MDVPRLTKEIWMFQNFHDGLSLAGTVCIGGSPTDSFEISHGLKQGCDLPFSLSFWQHYYLQCPYILMQEFSSAIDLVENYSNWLD